MDIEIIHELFRLDIYGFSGTAVNKDYTGTAFKLMGKMWQTVQSNNIKNNELYIDSYNYINKKDKNCCKYIEKFIDNYIITENNFISDEDDIDNISEFTNIENSIKNININIDNLNINVYNIHLTNDYFNKVTNPNIINL